MLMPDSMPDNIRTVLEALPQLSNDRGTRELTYQYSVGDLSGLAEAEAALREGVE